MRAIPYRRLLGLATICLAVCLIVVPHYPSALRHLVTHGTRSGLLIGAVLLAAAVVAPGWLKKAHLTRDFAQVAAICVGLCVITILHYTMSPHSEHAHDLLQGAYYFPIVLAALWYGARGGLWTAALAAVLYIPHIVITWSTEPSAQASKFDEVALFFLFGGLTGILSDRERGKTAELRKTAEQLGSAHEELKKSFESLRRAERLSALGTLSAALAHEIRSPLSAIEGAVEILGRPSLSSEQRHEFTAVFRREIERLNGLLYQFLEFAQPRPSVRRRTDIHQLVGGVCNLVAEMASTRKIGLVRPKLDAAVPKLAIDPDQIKEVLLNLVMNACEAMPDGGKIELFLEKRPDLLIVGVRDEGAGIQQADLQRIFDPFYTTKAEGTGLGLSIAQRIMEQHEGRIEAERNPERGMTFRLVFPAQSNGE